MRQREGGGYRGRGGDTEGGSEWIGQPLSACPASAHNQSSDDKVMMIEVPPAAANADIEIEPRMPQQSTLAYSEDTVEHSMCKSTGHVFHITSEIPRSLRRWANIQCRPLQSFERALFGRASGAAAAAAETTNEFGERADAAERRLPPPPSPPPSAPPTPPHSWSPASS